MPGKFQELNEMRNFVCDSFRADYVSIQHKIARKKKIVHEQQENTREGEVQLKLKT